MTGADSILLFLFCLALYSIVAYLISSKHPAAATVLPRFQGPFFFIASALFDPLLIQFSGDDLITETANPAMLPMLEYFLAQNDFLAFQTSPMGLTQWYDGESCWTREQGCKWSRLCHRRTRIIGRVRFFLTVVNAVMGYLFSFLTSDSWSAAFLTYFTRPLWGSGMRALVEKVATWELVMLPAGHGICFSNCDILSPQAVLEKLRLSGKESVRKRGRGRQNTVLDGGEKSVSDGGGEGSGVVLVSSPLIAAGATAPASSTLRREVSIDRSGVSDVQLRLARVSNLFGKTVIQAIIFYIFFQVSISILSAGGANAKTSGANREVLRSIGDPRALFQTLLVAVLPDAVIAFVRYNFFSNLIMRRHAIFFFNVFEKDNPTSRLNACGGPLRPKGAYEWAPQFLLPYLAAWETFQEWRASSCRAEVELWASLDRHKRAVTATSHDGNPLDALWTRPSGSRINQTAPVLRKKGSLVLVKAIRQQDLASVQRVLDDGADPVDATDEHGQEAIIEAARFKSTAIVSLLLDRGANLHARGCNGVSPIANAAMAGYVPMVQLLLDRGADPDSLVGDGTILFLAAARNNAGVIELLLRYGADVEARDSNQFSPLFFAVANGARVGVRILLAAGAHANVCDKNGTTALMMAVSQKDTTIIRLLVAYGARTDATSLYGETLKEYQEMFGSITMGRERGTPEVVKAVQARDAERLERLLIAGGDPDSMDYTGETALVQACQYEDSFRVVQVLLRFGARLTATNDKESMTLSIAVIRKSNELVNLLLDNGAPLETKNRFGNSALGVAAFFGNAQAAQVLLSRGADIESRNAVQNTPLITAAWKGNTKVVKLLLAHGAQIEATNKWNNTPLLLAAMYGHPSVVRVLLENGADPRARNSSGDTPISIATRNGHTSAARILRRHGVRV